MTSLYTGKSVDVIRVLLIRHPKAWTLRELAADAGVSLGQASKVSRALIKERIAIRTSARAELMLIDPGALLRRWAAVNNFASNTEFVEFYSPEEDVTRFLDSVKARQGPDYALTGLAGALLTAPFVRPANIHIYVSCRKDALAWSKKLGLAPVEESGNVKFAIAPCPGVFYGARAIDGVNVVSDVQLYVDLLNYPARGEEAAAAVLDVLRKNWAKVRD